MNGAQTTNSTNAGSDDAVDEFVLGAGVEGVQFIGDIHEALFLNAFIDNTEAAAWDAQLAARHEIAI